MTLVLFLTLAGAAPQDTVILDGSRWRGLLGPDIEEEEPPGPVVLLRDVRLEPREEEVRFSGSWTLRAPKKGWFEARLTGPDVQVATASFRGREVPLLETPEGVKLALELEGEGVLTVSGVAVGDPRRAPVLLDLLPAAVGRVRVDTTDEATITASGPVVRLDDGHWTGASGLALALGDPTPPAARPDLATATAALGLTVGEGSYEARGRVRWEVRHGELAEVVIDGRGLGADLDVTGPTVGSWRRSGDQVFVRLREPEDRLVELELTWSGPVPAGDEASLDLPQLRPQGAFKTESSVQLARDGEIEVVPRLQGWAATAFSDLPEWGRGLVAGTATATFTAAGVPGGAVGLFRFTPISGPPTFVDRATITAALTAEGNVLMRAHYAVRNDRSAHLRVSPPPGAEIVGARVAGETAEVARDGQTWLLPLEKSVETVEGLLSFPVEVTLLLRGEAWDRKEIRSLPLPRVDAPVAVTRATLHLPPGYESRSEPGEGDIVGGFSDGEGIAYGKGTGQAAEAEVLMQEAVQAWMGNSFDEAERLLRELEDVGGFDENARRLQSNLDVISGKGEGQYDVAMERRVKEQAKARSLEDQRAQEETLKKAEESYLSGDYAQAEAGYKRALDLGKKLDKLEQSESVELEVRNSAIEERVAAAEEKAEAKANKDKALKSISKNMPVLADPAPPPAQVVVQDQKIVLTEDYLRSVPAGRSYQSAVGTASGVGGGGRADTSFNGGSANENTFTLDGDDLDDAGVVFDFSGVEITGELVVPEGSYRVGGLVDGKPGPDTGAFLPPDEPEPVEEDELDWADAEPTVDLMVVERRSAGLRIPRIQVGKPKAGAPTPSRDGVVSDGPADRSRARDETIAFGSERDTRGPAVRAVQLTAVIPTQGQAVRYERLLLEPDADYALSIEAILRRRDR